MSVEKFEAESRNAFQDGLRRIITVSGLNQKEFAGRCNLSYEHLNRMLSNNMMNRPSINTLEKIAEFLFTSGHSNPDPYLAALYAACGYNLNMIDKAFRKWSHDQGIDTVIQEMGHRIESFMQDVILNHNNQMTSGTSDVPNLSMEDMIKESLKDSIVGYHTVRIKKVFPDPFAEDIECMHCTWEWTCMKDNDTEYVIVTHFVLRYIVSKIGRTIPVSAFFDPLRFVKYGLLKEVNQASYVYHISERKYDYDSTPEGRLLKNIFGDEDNPDNRPLYHTLYGIGFTYTKTSVGFINFMIHHADLFNRSERELELMDELRLLWNRHCTGEEGVKCVDELFKDYSDTGIKGTMGAVYTVLTRLSEDEFFEIEAGCSELPDDVDFVLDPVIYVGESMFCDGNEINKEKKEAAEAFMLQYAKELHMPTFGDTLRYVVYNVDVKKNQYAIEYEEEE